MQIRSADHASRILVRVALSARETPALTTAARLHDVLEDEAVIVAPTRAEGVTIVRLLTRRIDVTPFRYYDAIRAHPQARA